MKVETWGHDPRTRKLFACLAALACLGWNAFADPLPTASLLLDASCGFDSDTYTGGDPQQMVSCSNAVGGAEPLLEASVTSNATGVPSLQARAATINGDPGNAFLSGQYYANYRLHYRIEQIAPPPFTPVWFPLRFVTTGNVEATPPSVFLGWSQFLDENGVYQPNYLTGESTTFDRVIPFRAAQGVDYPYDMHVECVAWPIPGEASICDMSVDAYLDFDQAAFDLEYGPDTYLLDEYFSIAYSPGVSVEPDIDHDGIPDASDNCTLIANPSQIDADDDGYGNYCDADFDGNCLVNAVDLGVFKAAFFSTDPVVDLDSNGIVNVVDLGLLKLAFFGAPGPSGLTGVCDPPRIELTSDRLQLPSDGSQSAMLMAIMRDSLDNPLPGKLVTFSLDSGGIVVTQPVTDEAGVARAVVTPAGDRTDRTITASVLVFHPDGNVTRTIPIEVVGTTLGASGPGTVQPGESTQFSVALRDAGGAGIANTTVSLSSAQGNTLSPATVTTDINGMAQFTYTAFGPSEDLIDLSAPGETAARSVLVSGDALEVLSPAAGSEIAVDTDQTVTLRWQQSGAPMAGETVSVFTSRGTVVPPSVTTDASGEAQVTIRSDSVGAATIRGAVQGGPETRLDVEYVSPVAISLELRLDPVTITTDGTSRITVIARDAAGRAVKNQEVLLDLDDITGGTVAAASLLTDSRGQAQSEYQSSSVASTVNGVTVSASLTGNPGATDVASLTVVDEAPSIVFGLLERVEEANPAQYRKRLRLRVTDADDEGIPGLPVQVDVRSARYAKGFWWLDATDGLWRAFNRVSCFDEDVNRNGILDGGEDFNGNGQIEAGTVAAVAPGEIVTDAFGFGEVELVYPKQAGGWVDVVIEATAVTQGLPFTADTDLRLDTSREDEMNTFDGPPAPLVSISDFDARDLPLAVLDALDGSSGTYFLFTSLYGYNGDCSSWEF